VQQHIEGQRHALPEQKVFGQGQMGGAGYRQELGEALHQAQQDGIEQGHRQLPIIQAQPGAAPSVDGPARGRPEEKRGCGPDRGRFHASIVAMKSLDFRSDTVTRPGADMRAAMAAAEVSIGFKA